VFFLDHAWLVPLIPAVSFVVILLFGKRFPKGGSEVGVAALGASWLLSCGAFYQWVQRVDAAGGAKGAAGSVKAFASSLKLAATSSGERAAPVAPIVHSITWFQNAGIKFGVGIQIDGLAVMMMFVVTTISLLVHVYSMEYMRDDRRYTFFFAALSLFTASMLLLVVADNTLQLLVGWELVGLCSFMLIGHWWEEKPNSDAALKAFLTTRVGDIGLIVGVVMTYFIVQRATGTGSFNIVALNQAALSGKVGHLLVLMCAVSLMAAIVGKSGQFPLHTWLPDAMAGPTPVSALIHAATMVVAGVYLGARVYPVFFEGFSIGHGGVNLMAAIGGTTVIIGAALAFVQDDIKKVLAYSTISQLGYMVMGLGVGAWIAAIFHLFTHAFFKADLFLGAGSVSHSGAHHSFDMKKDMGGLKKYMPQTFATFVIGSVALAGIFPLAGFWSKDEILVTAGKGGYTFFMVVGLVGALMTAAYMTRCIYLTFFGEYRGGSAHHADDAHGHPAHDEHAPHESPPAITVPLWILSFFAVTAGLLNAEAFHIEKFKQWVEPRFAFPNLVHPAFSWPAAALSVTIALVGAVTAYEYYWLRRGLRDFSSRNALARVGKTFLVNKYYLDHLYTDIVVGSIKGPIANASYWVNQHVIDAVLNGVGRGSLSVARFTYDVLDQRGVDGIVNGLAVGTGEAGGAARAVETGRLQWYALIMFSGVTLFSVFLWIAH
jgi:NADH-quinone oxidoreductase subunit L